jgi:ABC-type thiamine transport system ATPase subunit
VALSALGGAWIDPWMWHLYFSSHERQFFITRLFQKKTCFAILANKKNILTGLYSGVKLTTNQAFKQGNGEFYEV